MKHRAEEIHLDDFDNLNRLKVQLRALAQLRMDQGATIKDLSDSVGRGHSYVKQLWHDHAQPTFWEYSGFLDLCTAVGMKPVAIHSFPAVGPMMALALESPRFLGAALQEVLMLERQGQQLSHESLGALRNAAKSGTWRFENSDDPRLSSLQRYARILDGWIKFGIVEA